MYPHLSHYNPTHQIMNHVYKQKLEFKISHAQSNLRYLILNDPDNTESIEDIKKEIRSYKNELQDYIALQTTPTHDA